MNRGREGRKGQGRKITQSNKEGVLERRRKMDEALVVVVVFKNNGRKSLTSGVACTGALRQGPSLFSRLLHCPEF
jgi:hypothetical protein